MVEKLGAIVEDPVLLVEVDGERRRVVLGAGEEGVDSARPVAPRHSGCSEAYTSLTKQNISLASRARIRCSWTPNCARSVADNPTKSR